MLVDLTKAFGTVHQQVVVWRWATKHRFLRRISGVLGGQFEQQRRMQVENRVLDPLVTMTAALPGSWWIVQSHLTLFRHIGDSTREFNL